MEPAVVFDLVSALLAVGGMGASGRLYVLLRRTRRDDLRARAANLDEIQFERNLNALHFANLEAANRNLGNLGDRAERERSRYDRDLSESALQIANLQGDNRAQRARYDRDLSESAQQVANLEGQNSVLRDRGERYDAIVQGHQWHLAGRVTAHGKELLLYECAICRSDPLANVRILALAGVMPE